MMRKSDKRKMNIGLPQIHRKRMASVADVDVILTSGMSRAKRALVSQSGLKSRVDGPALRTED
jgi:hypothetical protein